MFDGVRAVLKERGYKTSVLILREPNKSYFEKLERLHASDPEIIGFDQDGGYSRLIRQVARVPFFGALISAWATSRFVTSCFKRSSVELLATTDDRALFYPLAVMEAARRLKIRTMLLPVETVMFVQALEDDKAAIRLSNNPLKRVGRWIVEKRYAANVRLREGKPVHFYQLRHVLPFLLWRSLLPRNPWVRGSHSFISTVAVNSALQLEENVANGIAKESIEITGFPPHDRFDANDRERQDMKKDLYAAYHIEAERKLFLLIGTHLTGEYSLKDIPMIHKELREVYKSIVNSVPKEFFIVMKLHPQANKDEEISFFDANDRSRIIFVQTEYDAYKLTLIADAVFMFTSSVAMATLARDIPVIAYKLHFPSFETFYKPFHSIQLVRDLESLQSVLLNMKFSLSKDEDKRRQEDRLRLGMFDGHSGRRVADCIVRMVQ